MDVLPGSKLGSVVHSRISTAHQGLPHHCLSLEQKDHAHAWDTVRHSEDTAKKNKPSQRDTYHDSPDSRVPTTGKAGGLLQVQGWPGLHRGDGAKIQNRQQQQHHGWHRDGREHGGSRVRGMGLGPIVQLILSGSFVS